MLQQLFPMFAARTCIELPNPSCRVADRFSEEDPVLLGQCQCTSGHFRWFVELSATFQDADHIYMLMEPSRPNWNVAFNRLTKSTTAFKYVGLCFFTVSVLESSWEVGLGRAIPPNHTPNHTPEPYLESYPLKNAKKNLQELWH